MKRRVLLILHCDLEAASSLGVTMGGALPFFAPWARVVVRGPAPPAPEEFGRLLRTAVRMLGAAGAGELDPPAFRVEGPDAPASDAALAALQAVAHAAFEAETSHHGGAAWEPADPRGAAPRVAPPPIGRIGAVHGGGLGLLWDAAGAEPPARAAREEAERLAQRIRTHAKKYGGSPDFSEASPQVANYVRSVTARPDLPEALVEQIRILLTK